MGSLILGCVIYKNMIRRLRREYNSGLKQKEDAIKTNSLEMDRLYEIESKTREKELSVVKIYEITKDLSVSLKFDGIFSVFSRLLRENFVFGMCELVLMKESELDLAVDRIYKVRDTAAPVSGEALLNYSELIKLFRDNTDEIYFSRKADSSIFDNLKIEEGVKTFAAIPLVGEKKTVGILVIEDLPSIDLDKIMIMTMQFALEMKRVLLYEKVEELAITDGLTGLYSRRYFLGRLDEETNRSKRYKFGFAFLMIDIDNFKKCNDTYGHLVGDVALKEVGRVIKESIREIDLASRYGGEELSILLPETARKGALLVAERIRERIGGNAFKAYDEELRLTVSIGISIFPGDAKNTKELIEHADKALYTAKRSGKNLVCEYKK